MAPAARQVVYVDTNVVIEATRTACWATLIQHFDVRTVEVVRQEAQSGKGRGKGYVPVDASVFDANVKVEKVSQVQIAAAQLRSTLIAQIDAGERELLAYVATQDKNALLLSTGDRAAVRAACALGLDNQLRSLEELAQKCGQQPDVAEWFTKAWLSRVRTECLLDAL
jgi:hypothetical protein